MSDDFPRRPFDHHVEPLFAGLGVEDRPPQRAPRRGALAVSALLLLAAGAVLAWWLG